jgi:hypothetical protein
VVERLVQVTELSPSIARSSRWWRSVIQAEGTGLGVASHNQPTSTEEGGGGGRRLEGLRVQEVGVSRDIAEITTSSLARQVPGSPSLVGIRSLLLGLFGAGTNTGTCTGTDTAQTQTQSQSQSQDRSNKALLWFQSGQELDVCPISALPPSSQPARHAVQQQSAPDVPTSVLAPCVCAAEVAWTATVGGSNWQRCRGDQCVYSVFDAPLLRQFQQQKCRSITSG